jgi:hypothetical protein
MGTEYIVGSVVSVLRYPVKSMMGEELTVADVAEGGSKCVGCPRPPRQQ